MRTKVDRRIFSRSVRRRRDAFDRVSESGSADFFEIRTRGRNQRIVRVVDDEARRGAGYLADVLLLDVIDLHLFVCAALGVVGGQCSGLLENAVGKLFALGSREYPWRGTTSRCRRPA